jgi:Glycosyl hydrolase family 26
MPKEIFFLLLVFFSKTLCAQKFSPPAGKQLLIIGQDLDAVKNYADTKKYPSPGGHTVYINLFAVNDSKANYGGLGEDKKGNPVADVDWGAGPVNAHTAAFDLLYKNSVLVIGLYMNTGEKIFKDVAKGKSDKEIKRLGTFIQKVKKPVFLRIGYEFDGMWNPAYTDVAAYKAAYRRVVEVLRKQGVNNFASVWQTSASPIDDIIEKKHENIEDWYPGDDVVDWMGFSWFLNPDFKSPVAEIKTTQGELAEELIALAQKHSKAVMIAESTPQGYDLKNNTKRNISSVLDGAAGNNMLQLAPQQIWNDWYKPYFDFIQKNKDVVKAVAYINANWDVQRMWGNPYNSGYWGNSRVQDNDYISQQWVNEVSKDNWLHGTVELFAILGSDK